MAVTNSPMRKPSKHMCVICERTLDFTWDEEAEQFNKHWIESGHTGNRYCWPGEGCDRNERGLIEVAEEAPLPPDPSPAPVVNLATVLIDGVETQVVL